MIVILQIYLGVSLLTALVLSIAASMTNKTDRATLVGISTISVLWPFFIMPAIIVAVVLLLYMGLSKLLSK